MRAQPASRVWRLRNDLDNLHGSGKLNGLSMSGKTGRRKRSRGTAMDGGRNAEPRGQRARRLIGGTPAVLALALTATLAMGWWAGCRLQAGEGEAGARP